MSARYLWTRYCPITITLCTQDIKFRFIRLVANINNIVHEQRGRERNWKGYRAGDIAQRAIGPSYNISDLIRYPLCIDNGRCSPVTCLTKRISSRKQESPITWPPHIRYTHTHPIAPIHYNTRYTYKRISGSTPFPHTTRI